MKFGILQKIEKVPKLKVESPKFAEYLVNITNVEFLCRKLNIGHVGIVQNFIFFIKSARRFRKTISTLASQRVACVPGIPRPMTVHFGI